MPIIYRWPPTRMTDEGIDAALTRLAGPCYRLTRRWRGRSGMMRRRARNRQPRLNACPARNLLFAQPSPQSTSGNSTDWKLDEYDPEKPAQRRKSRHRLLGRSRHQRGAVVDEAERRPRLCLYRQSRPARRGRLQRDSAQGAGVRRRKSPAGGLPHATGARRYRRRSNPAPSTSPPAASPISTPRRSVAP